VFVWWGKLIGGACGYWLGGPFGLILGVILGHQFDRSLANLDVDFASGMGGPAHQAQVQQVFFETTFAVMGHMAKADGRVSEEEIALARQVMFRMGLSETAQREAIDHFTRGKHADFSLREALSRFRRACFLRHNLVQMFLEIQLHAAYADGEMHTTEREVLLDICRALGVSQADFQRLDAMIQAELHMAQEGGAQAKPSLDDAYAILNVAASASDAEVKRAYRRLMNRHHPDKLMAKGLPEEMMKIAEEKTIEIRAAYERIREARGF
jgi:DnaJ like chaperone protein